MNDSLFPDLPAASVPSLDAARARYDAAMAALNEIEAGGTDDTGCATEAAEKALALAEKELHRLELERLGK